MLRYDNVSSSATLLLLLAGIVLFTAVEVQSRELDCRRFVFAPICRGATIKRSFVPNMGVNEDDVRDMLVNYPKKQTMETENQPFVIPMLLDQRFVDVRSSVNRHQAQTDAED
ncbi:abdominal ganglion neuropeptide L11-like [Daphnia carinata]|uniref:abdominal ganglion neuropeptide L11-like n=1 Tax=Daphnia carinata TaxID=120202 RepID=UPI00258076A5|nr:abdominal ganglion neuropeptide L11-like [Daphnia carinata]XP_057366356.1 abdominal ganglion neuropeptide L11-like [Daphnia carinata]